MVLLLVSCHFLLPFFRAETHCQTLLKILHTTRWKGLMEMQWQWLWVGGLEWPSMTSETRQQDGDSRCSWASGGSSARAPCRGIAPPSRRRPAGLRCCSRPLRRRAAAAVSPSHWPAAPASRGRLRPPAGALHGDQEEKKRNWSACSNDCCRWMAINTWYKTKSLQRRQKYCGSSSRTLSSSLQTGNVFNEHGERHTKTSSWWNSSPYKFHLSLRNEKSSILETSFQNFPFLEDTNIFRIQI